jgi:hypothetical protein
LAKNIETLLLQYRAEDIRSNYGGIMHLCLEIVKAHLKVDPNPETKKLLKDLNYIKQNTSKKLNTPYFIVVHVVARNMHKPLSFPIEVRVGNRRTREFELGELIQELEDAHIAINEIQQAIARHYSIDIPISKHGQAVVFDFSNPQHGMKERFKHGDEDKAT